MTVAALRMTLRFPASLLVAFANLVFIILTVALPLGTMIVLALHDEAKALWILDHVFQFWPVRARMLAEEAGTTTPRVVAATFAVWLFSLYAVWATLVTFGSLVATTIIMHTGVMQLRGQKPSLREAFRVARRNVWRLAGLAVLAGVGLTIARYFTRWIVIPGLSGVARKAIFLAMTAALYITLPIIVYERKGAWNAFKSTFQHVKETWGGLVVGTGFIAASTWLLLWPVEYAVLILAEALLGIQLVEWTTILLFQLGSAVILYSLNVALAANLRAALYLHVTEGTTSVLPDAAFVAPPAAAAPRTAATFEVVSQS